ncbi:MAG TPA: aminotransferase class I/II-fold pyridoxal phosphate-dependent enzyme [Candidatus Absconditabacterales bacterium]|nr:aminotransferase class I/II-fold pyridoxal phosphate-dependent enzyme [Candidatus Absconditabacterales bacterium]
MPKLSKHFQSRKPSAIRTAQIEFMKRTDDIKAINTAIGNVSLPAHPAMQKRMFDLQNNNSPFKDGVIKYTATVGEKETNEAFLNIIRSSGFSTNGLYSQITDGGSQAMELMTLGVCGEAGKCESPLLLIDAAYTNYVSMADRVGRKTTSVRRTLEDDGQFTLPDISEIEKLIETEKPGAIVVIPYDNPTGQYYNLEAMKNIAKLCVKYDMRMISDEAYREFYYTGEPVSSIRGITNKEVPGIEGKRISIETSSKVWNACGLRIGALITDNQEFHQKSVAENTASLCSNAIGQYIFGALAHESKEDLNIWYKEQRKYYFDMMNNLTKEFKKQLPGIIVSSPDASIYSVVDVKNIAKPGFDAMEFVLYCAQKGSVGINGKKYTLLVSPMTGFYKTKDGEKNPGLTQMRIAYVDTPEHMKLVPELFSKLFKEFEKLK